MLHFPLRCAGVLVWLLFSRSLAAQQPVSSLTLGDGTVLRGAVKITRSAGLDQVSLQPEGATARNFSLPEVKAVTLAEANGRSTEYKVYTVQYDTSPHRNEQLMFDAGPRYKTSTVLLEQLHIGAYKLYRRIDDADRTHFFVQKADSTPIELLKKRYFNVTRDTVHDNNRYQKQLAYYCSDCPEASREGLEASYSQRSIERVLKLYDRCKGVTAVVQNRPKSRLTFGLIGGGFYVQPFSKEELLNGRPITYTERNSYRWQAGVQGELFPVRFRNRWSYATDLQISRYEARFINFDPNVDLTTTNLRYRDYFHDRYWTIRWSHLLRRQFTPTPRQRWWVGGGISASFNSKRDREQLTIESNLGVTVDSFYTYPPRLRTPADMGFVANAGYQFGRFGVEARFDWLFGNLLFSQSTIYPSRRSSTFVLLSYRLVN